MNSKKIFITYSSFDEEFVEGLRHAIEITFDNCEVFAFKESLKLEDDWFGRIRNEIANADIHIVVLSPVSVEKPWTYLEAGCTWGRKKTPLVMKLALSEDKIPPSNPLSKIWHGDFFKKEDISRLFNEIADYIPLKNTARKEEMKEKFIKQITNALGDSYKILEGFKKLTGKKKGKLYAIEPAPVPAILKEAFGDRWQEEIGVQFKEGKVYFKDIDRIGKIIRAFDSLIRQGLVEKIQTSFEKFLNGVIEKVELKVDSPEKLVSCILRKNPVLSQIYKKEEEEWKRSQSKISNFPLLDLEQNKLIVDRSDLIFFLHTQQVIEEILKFISNKKHLAYCRNWYSVITDTKELWDKYECYLFPLTSESSHGELSSGIMGIFHSLLASIDITYRNLREFLRSWYKLKA